MHNNGRVVLMQNETQIRSLASEGTFFFLLQNDQAVITAQVLDENGNIVGTIEKE